MLGNLVWLSNFLLPSKESRYMLGIGTQTRIADSSQVNEISNGASGQPRVSFRPTLQRPWPKVAVPALSILPPCRRPSDAAHFPEQLKFCKDTDGKGGRGLQTRACAGTRGLRDRGRGAAFYDKRAAREEVARAWESLRAHSQDGRKAVGFLPRSLLSDSQGHS